MAFQKIDRRSKPIKKHEKYISESLNRKEIFLDLETFDILTLLQRHHKKNQQYELRTPTKTPTNTHMMDTDFAVPCSVLKTKPLKSDKDRKAAMERES